MAFSEQTSLGSTSLKVGRLGISSSFGAPAEAYEEAFERGCNYFNWGTFIRGRSGAMGRAIHNIAAKGRREDLLVAMLTYAHIPWLTEHFFVKGLKAAKLDYADVLLLGWFPKRPPQKIIDGALKLKEKGLVRFIGITSHNRTVFPELAKEGLLDIFHFRYNAAHRGAESDIFPHINGDDRPGMVSFTATDWQKLLKAKKMPAGQKPLTATECYRFVLSNPSVDVCMMGARNSVQMRENLAVLEEGPLTAEEQERIALIGRHVYGK